MYYTCPEPSTLLYSQNQHKNSTERGLAHPALVKPWVLGHGLHHYLQLINNQGSSDQHQQCHPEKQRRSRAVSLLPGLARKRSPSFARGPGTAPQECSTPESNVLGVLIYIKCEFHLATTPFWPQQVGSMQDQSQSPSAGEGDRGKSLGLACAAGIISGLGSPHFPEMDCSTDLGSWMLRECPAAPPGHPTLWLC